MDRDLAPTPHTYLWLVAWGGPRLSVLDASSAERATASALSRCAARGEGWPRSGTMKIQRIWPIRALELSVRPRALLNQPGSGRLLVGGIEISWSGPHTGKRPGTFRDGPPLEEGIASAAPERTRLWSYAWSDRELVLFNAPDRPTATAWAERSGYARQGAPDAGSVESVEAIEVQLARDAAGWSPICYRVWIQSCRVGWPPTEEQDPSPPLAAEARLPVPRYSVTGARSQSRKPRS